MNAAVPQTPETNPRAHGDGRAVEVSIVIPVHDEAGAIGTLIDEIVAALDDHVCFEIVVVDDGSTDTTPDVLLDASRRHARLRIVRHHHCRGQSAGLVSGVAAARAPWIATLDGDGQNDPRDIIELWQARHDPSRPGMICGTRLTRRDSLSKRIASRLANAIRDRVLGDGVPDTGCGLKLFERALFESLPAFDHMHRFLPALARARGVALVTVPVRHRPRATGRSKYGILDRALAGAIDLVGVSWLIRRGFWSETKRREVRRAEATVGHEGLDTVPLPDDASHRRTAPSPQS